MILNNTNILNKLIIISLIIVFAIITVISKKDLFHRLINNTLIEFGSEKGIVFDNERLTKFNYNGNEISFMPQHMTYLIISINMFKEKPIFGHGPRMFKKNSCDKYKINQFSCSSHPHNIYLQLLSENGLFGVLLLLAFFVYISLILLKEIIFFKKRSPFELQILIIAFFINLFPLAQTGNFYGNWNSILFYLPLGFYFGIKQIKVSKRSNN